MAAEASAAHAEQLSIAATQAALDLGAQAASLDAQAAGETQLAQAAQAQADYYANLATNPPSTFEQTLFAYDLAGHLIGEYALDGAVKVEYAWLEDMPLAQLRNASGPLGGTAVYWYQADHLNTPTSLTDEAKQVVWDAVREPFGKTELAASSVTNNLRFPGQFEDAETGLHYNYFRDYDPGTGRYVESDPIGLDGGVNTFAYGLSSPERWADPSGLYIGFWHRTFTESAALMAGMSAVAARELAQAVVDVDAEPGSQDVMNAQVHAMCQSGFTKQICQESLDKWIHDELAKCTQAGLAHAIHAGQDSYSDAHRGLHFYSGFFLLSPMHILQDSFPSTDDAIENLTATQNLIQQFNQNCNKCNQGGGK